MSCDLLPDLSQFGIDNAVQNVVLLPFPVCYLVAAKIKILVAIPTKKTHNNDCIQFGSTLGSLK
jgi:hypothetical protein